MATSEDVKRESEPQDADAEALPEASRRSAAARMLSSRPSEAGRGRRERERRRAGMRAAGAVTQLGTRRYVYAGYFAGAIAIAFIMSKVLGYAWYRLQTYKPAIGEPQRRDRHGRSRRSSGRWRAVYYWYRTRARELAEEVATEMSKVTWPTRTEVTNGTFVVIVTTIISTVFFALMDKFWGFVTNLVYGGS